MISVVVPAHDEEARIGACLGALLDGAPEGAVEVVVVANGCRDRTAELARSVGPPVRVIELSEASKVAALNAGDRAASGFPRFYVDGDVTIRWPDVARIADALTDDTVLIAAPARRWGDGGRPWTVRAYHRVLDSLPQVRASLTGAGVLAVSEHGRGRFDVFPDVSADDRFLEAQFEPHERRTVERAVSVVEMPMTLAGLVRRRTRVVLGNAELARLGVAATSSQWRSLWHAVRVRPSLVADLPAFLAVTAVARLRAARLRRTGRSTWERDDSTR